MKARLKLRISMLLNLLVCTLLQLRGQDLVIYAQIDGLSRLIIQQESIYWDHVTRNRPGTHDTNTFTSLNGFEWFAEWSTTANRDPGPSKPISAETLYSQSKIEAHKISGRGNVTIVEQPTETNQYSLVVEFDDIQPPGHDFYEIRLVGVRTTVRPQLTLNYKSLLLHFPTQTNRYYLVEYSDDVTSLTWQSPYPRTLGNGSTNIVSVGSLNLATNRFYRLRIED